MSGNSELIQCPYNSAHMIMKYRMASHLIKCRKQHPLETHVTCPLNSTHDVPKSELQYHLENCPDKKVVEKFVYVTEEPKPIDRSAFEIELPDCRENWDQEMQPCTSYLNVKEDIVQKNLVLRQPVGKSKAKRKEFLENEMKRFGENTSSNDK